MANKKIIGWVLIALGLLIIFWGIYSTFNIFIGKKDAPEVFKVGQIIEADVSDKEENASNNNVSQEQLQREMEKTVSEEISKIIPQEAIYKILNLISWSIFATILFFGGGKIASIGISMLKN